MRSVLIVASRFMAGLAESIVPMPATLQKGLVKPMSHELLMQEAKYQSAMQVFRGWLVQGIITQTDYTKAEQLMREKYHPRLGTLFFDMALT